MSNQSLIMATWSRCSWLKTALTIIDTTSSVLRHPGILL